MTSCTKGRIAVVTGGNKGIGYCIVKTLCQKLKDEQGLVYLTARKEERGKTAINQLNQEGVHPAFHQLDIESKDSVKRFAQFLKTTHGGLDILVNNAGIAYFTSPHTPLALQARNTLDVNYFGTLNVCDELLPLLRGKARVVNVSSGLGHLSKINGLEPAASQLRDKLSSDNLNVEDLNRLVNDYIKFASEGTHKENGWPNSAYAVSKVAITALTRIQQRGFDLRRPHDNIAVNAVHPGWVQSDMTGGKGIYNTEEGSEAPVYAALLPDSADVPKGQYIWRDKSVTDWVDKRSIADKHKT
ncbi:unnamed protein product [Orchesella dallaii]|uniref:carbonyl reductase (NADPH) n=1 Tax=Orchesella dallaii TaxID=48710 RepID=A0ABP1Q610_9HEXA